MIIVNFSTYFSLNFVGTTTFIDKHKAKRLVELVFVFYKKEKNMATNIKYEEIDGTEQKYARDFVNSISSYINNSGYLLETQQNLPYTNFCYLIDEKGKGIKHKKGQNLFSVDILLSRKTNEGKIPLVVVEVKLKYNTHEILTYSMKAEKHKSVFPFLRYGFLVLYKKNREIPNRFYMHQKFDFNAHFTLKEFTENSESDELQTKLREFAELLISEAKIAERDHKRIFNYNAKY